MAEPVSHDSLHVELLEARYELASLAADESADEGCCSGSCCIVTDCLPGPTNPEPQ